jgi:hypothetical protein
MEATVLGLLKKLLLITVALLCFTVPQTHASDAAVTADILGLSCAGNVPGLYDKKNKDQERYIAYCNGYFTGMSDGFGLYKEQGKTLGGFCAPIMTAKEFSIVFFDYLATHSELKKLPAGEVVLLAFREKWPCR